MELRHISDKQLLEEKNQIRLNLTNCGLEYARPGNSSAEKLALSTTIADLRVRFADLQHEILERRYLKIGYLATINQDRKKYNF